MRELAPSEFLAQFQTLITYVPLRTEVPLERLLALPKVPTYTILPRASLDPFQEAKNAVAFVAGRQTAILIPGRAFDRLGTRHGQGGGWYDRFLSLVPQSWTRIGVCLTEQISPTPLTRHEWDEPMDSLFIYDKAAGSLTLVGVD